MSFRPQAFPGRTTFAESRVGPDQVTIGIPSDLRRFKPFPSSDDMIVPESRIVIGTFDNDEDRFPESNLTNQEIASRRNSTGFVNAAFIVKSDKCEKTGGDKTIEYTVKDTADVPKLRPLGVTYERRTHEKEVAVKKTGVVNVNTSRAALEQNDVHINDVVALDVEGDKINIQSVSLGDDVVLEIALTKAKPEHYKEGLVVGRIVSVSDTAENYVSIDLTLSEGLVV